MKEYVDGELPLGFGMALAQNEVAMQRFESMPRSARLDIIGKAHNVNSKREMQQIVDSIIKK